LFRPLTILKLIQNSETQGEKAYKAGDERSRSPSTSSESRSPRFNVQTPLIVDTAVSNFSSNTTNYTTPQERSDTGSGRTADAFGSADPTAHSFNYASPSDDQRTNRFARDPLGPATPESASGQGFAAMNPISFPQAYHSQNILDQFYLESGTQTGIPALTLQVPDAPGLSYASSPWYSPTTSTPSDQYGNGIAWIGDGSAFMATTSDTTGVWSPQYSNLSMQFPSTAGLEAVPGNYESPSYVSPVLSPLNTTYSLAGSSTVGGYAELVGTKALSSTHKYFINCFTEPSARFSSSRFERFNGAKKSLVDVPPRKSWHGQLSISSTALNEQIKGYLISYWTLLEPVYAIIHPETFDFHSNELIRRAMAALGSQFHSLSHDRANGSQLHESCTVMIALVCYTKHLLFSRCCALSCCYSVSCCYSISCCYSFSCCYSLIVVANNAAGRPVDFPNYASNISYRSFRSLSVEED
jgi:hypothetical protein